jgi:putative ABC transport system permease protein
MRFRLVGRRFARAPLFTSLMLVTLAVGIGATTAIFSIVEGVLLKPLPYLRAETLVAVDHAAPGINLAHVGMAPFLYFPYRDRAKSFDALGIWSTDTATVTGLSAPEEVTELDVTADMLPLLGLQPIVGRLFTTADDAPGSADTVILMPGYWQSRFGGDRSVVGRSLVLDDQPSSIVGVLPDTFQFLDQTPSVVRLLRLDRSKTTLGQFSYQGIARLKAGVTIAAADAELARIIPQTLHEFPPIPGFSVKMFEEARISPLLRPLKDTLVGDVTSLLWILMGTVGFVWLIACANVANLLLVRVEGRQHELAIRTALGASRAEIARDLLVESLTLGLVGGLLGLAVADGGVRLLRYLSPANLPRADQIAINGTVLGFTLVVSLLAGVLFGLFPIVKYGRRTQSTLRSEGRTVSQSKERHRARNTLVIAQSALALVLLVSSGLMIRTFQALKHVDPGFVAAETVETLSIAIPAATLGDPVLVTRTEQALLARMAAVPGVSSVGATSHLPMDGDGWHDAVFAEGKSNGGRQLPPIRRYQFVSPGLLATMGHRLVAGREFSWTDTLDMRPVALVSENLAREWWGEPQAALGQHVRESLNGTWREIVGVVGDVRDDGLNQPASATVYWPLLMNGFGDSDKPFNRRTLFYVLRTPRTGSAGLLADLRQTVASVNPNVPVVNVRSLQTLSDRSLARTSFTLVMLAIGGAMALLLGLSGLYGVLSYSVSQRTREIGIRLALGAQAGDVTRMFLLDGAKLAALGIACGVVAAVALTRVMASMLFAVSPLDPVTFGSVAVGVAGAALLASYIPAFRATRVNPVEALRTN